MWCLCQGSPHSDIHQTLVWGFSIIFPWCLRIPRFISPYCLGFLPYFRLCLGLTSLSVSREDFIQLLLGFGVPRDPLFPPQVFGVTSVGQSRGLPQGLCLDIQVSTLLVSLLFRLRR